jgi:molecular chaperone DnaK
VAEGITLREREESFAQPSNIAWSPDSRRIAYAADVGDGQSLFVATPGERVVRRITSETVRAIDPAWRPDGSVIAFQDESSETLHVVAPDGSGERQLARLPHTFLWPEWSPDGSMIATTADRDGQSEIFTISADGTTFHNVSNDPAGDLDPTWSPDGSRLAWTRLRREGSRDRAHLVVAQSNGPNITEIRVDADFAPPTWSPDGSRIFSYVADANGAFYELIVIDPTGVSPVVHLQAPGNVGNSNWQRRP